jgi:hypothetical protein
LPSGQDNARVATLKLLFRIAPEGLGGLCFVDGREAGRYGTMLADLERTGEAQTSLTDFDSRMLAAHR